MKAVEEVLAGIPRADIHRVVPRPLDVEGATRRIRDLLSVRDRIEFRDACGEAPGVAESFRPDRPPRAARMGEIRLIQS